MTYDSRTLNDIETKLLTWGNPLKCNDDVILCITGNPGIPDFYEEFGSELHKLTGKPVCVIGHAGHDVLSTGSIKTFKDHKQLFNLEGQLKHKLDLIMNHVDKECKLHLIGHSIGAWLLIELFENNDSLLHRTKSINLLFPTIQRMAESNNGKFLNNLLRNFHGLVMLLYTIVSFLPEAVVRFFVNIYLKYNSLPKCYVKRILKFLYPEVGEKVLFLAYDEMDRVVRLNHNVLEQIKHLTNVTYSTRDPWAPVHYMDDLKMYQPQLQMQAVDINHSFVLKSSERVAEIVSQSILNSQQ